LKVETICEECDFSRSTAFRALRTLEELELVFRTRREFLWTGRQLASRYTLCVPPSLRAPGFQLDLPLVEKVKSNRRRWERDGEHEEAEVVDLCPGVSPADTLPVSPADTLPVSPADTPITDPGSTNLATTPQPPASGGLQTENGEEELQLELPGTTEPPKPKARRKERTEELAELAELARETFGTAMLEVPGLVDQVEGCRRDVRMRLRSLARERGLPARNRDLRWALRKLAAEHRERAVAPSPAKTAAAIELDWDKVTAAEQSAGQVEMERRGWLEPAWWDLYNQGAEGGRLYEEKLAECIVAVRAQRAAG